MRDYFDACNWLYSSMEHLELTDCTSSLKEHLELTRLGLLQPPVPGREFTMIWDE